MELAGWPRRVHVPLTGWSFHLIYGWAVLVLLVGAAELAEKGKRRTEWLLYWQSRARILAGNVDEIAQILLGARPGGHPASADRVIASILQQVVDVVGDLLHPAGGVEIMACMLVPVEEGRGTERRVVALQTVAYNQNTGRHKARLPIDATNPAAEAFRAGRPVVIADTRLRGGDCGGSEDCAYRSVIAVPVHFGGSTERQVAVVLLDATRPGYFTEDVRIEKGVDLAIFPFVKLAGLARFVDLKRRRYGKAIE